MRGELLEASRVYSIVGAFYEVYNYYGYGLRESVYAGALAYELVDRGHAVVRDLAVAVSYKGRHVAWQRLDMVVDQNVIVETKASEHLSPAAAPATRHVSASDLVRGWPAASLRTEGEVSPLH